mmetsp:Transcript_4397/g.12384  ORF Transcript_4397/g.12384 Transcript_4397/m.12384 type:complete len:625 (+) Transcript_4397:43-1917(+)|eukprot:CAMPEP_0185174342 /NCGR_PEP_ID=MMETSP1139-20130426/25082_1 /TAXON_ID=298111 /ORGANISM="Pavlova sp., Strain CCMP459" /LENGTH=624 /DNA_ID=CAMNT_0027740053 /DNA_START=27 /DNA_END=1901 /DNA_ORIENTATION=+
MPTVGIQRDLLFKALGKEYTEDEFQDLCFEFGIELDEVVQEKQLNTTKRNVGAAAAEEEVTVFKIEVPANRYDLLCLEGISTALNAFTGRSSPPTYSLTDPVGGSPLVMTVQPETAAVRPYIVCAVLRGISLDTAAYNSLIDLQDRMHHNICRRRTLVAIGTHDLDTLAPPFTYEARRPEDIKFRPLGEDREFTAPELMVHYDKDTKMNKFTPIIRNEERYPVLYDSQGRVLSLPPIINGHHSRMGPDIKNILIECTATDLTKANIVLNTLVAMFSGYCAKPFTVEPVTVQYPSGPSHPKLAGQAISYPDLSDGTLHADVGYVQRGVGLPPEELPPAKMVELLDRMMLPTKHLPEQNVLAVTVPITRSDILHACDVMEDVAIAYSINKIPRVVPFVKSHGGQQPLNALQELMRHELAAAGYTETLCFALCSHEEAFAAMQLKDDGKTAVTIGNPKTTDFELCRTSLVPGLLKTAASNRKLALPWKYFEVSDIVLQDPSADVGAKNERRVSAVCMLPGTSGFEQIHGLVDRIMVTQGLARQAGTLTPGATDVGPGQYSFLLSEHPSFFPGRQAQVFVNTLTPAGKPNGTRPAGHFGMVHPDVLKAFDLPFPASALEIDLEVFCDI